MKKIVKIFAFRGNSGNSGGDGDGDGLLNSNHRGMGRGKTTGDLEERVPWVPRGIPIRKFIFMTIGGRQGDGHFTGAPLLLLPFSISQNLAKDQGFAALA